MVYRRVNVALNGNLHEEVEYLILHVDGGIDGDVKFITDTENICGGMQKSVEA